MSPRRRLVYYLLLNALVSACVTGTILFFYDRANRADCGPSAVIPTLPIATSPVSGEIKVEIVSVIGAGMTASEVVVIKNNGADPVVLTGWFLQDKDGNTYTFPQLTLYPDGTAQVHTAAGVDTARDLYWGRVSPVWRSGELASLYDAHGNLRDTYTIP